MTADDASAMRALRGRLAKQFAQKVGDADAPLPELRDLQERLRLIDLALADPQRAAGLKRRATWLALAAVAAMLSLGALIPMPSVPFSIEAEAGAVRLQMDAAGELGPQAVAGELVVEGYTALQSPDAGLMQQDSTHGRGRLAIGADTLNLRRIGFPAASTIDASAGPQAAVLTLHSAQGPIGVDIELAGHASTRFGAAGSRTQADYPFAEWLQLRAGAASQAPPPVTVALARAPTTDYAWSGLRPSAVHFVQRALRSGDEAAIVSSLQSARLRLQASGEEVQLGNGDTLDLAGLDVQRCDLVLGPVLHLKMTGTARELSTRTGDFERSLKPSVLEYAARHKRVALLWSAALLLWGVARWLQRLRAGEA